MVTKKSCPECKSNKLSVDHKRGEVVCNSCGIVMDENMLDQGQEWREFSDGQDERRSGAPSSYAKHDMGTGTEVGTSSEVYSLNVKDRRKYLRLRKWHNRSSTSLERNLKYALADLKRISSLLNIPPKIE